jgi:hypothetical protein
MGDWRSIRNTQEQTGLSNRGLYAEIRAGTFNPIPISPGRKVIDQDEIDAFKKRKVAERDAGATVVQARASALGVAARRAKRARARDDSR